MTPKKEDAAGPIRKLKRGRLSIVWVVPLLAAVAAGWLIYDRIRRVGPTIQITFADGQGLEAGQTPLRYRGVKIGTLRSVGLTDNSRAVLAKVSLDASARTMARDGALFWIVRPEVSVGGFHGLETLVSGAYIQVQPGTGKEQTKFTGLEQTPMIPSTKEGLEVTLFATDLGSITAGAPVYFRGMEVGAVESYSLGEDSTRILVRIRIDSPYAGLVTADSKFWNAGGLNVNLHFFAVNISAESMKSLFAGGIAFANPPAPGASVKDGATFPLYPKPDEKWLRWTSPLPPGELATNTQAAR